VQLERVRAAWRGVPFGAADGTRIVLKLKGAPYDDAHCRLLASVGTRSQPAAISAPELAPVPPPTPPPTTEPALASEAAPAPAADAPPRTLAFPPLGVGPNAFDVARAAATTMGAVAAFLRGHSTPQLRLLLALDDPSTQLAAFEAAHAAELGLASESRFSLRAAPLLALRSDAGSRFPSYRPSPCYSMLHPLTMLHSLVVVQPLATLHSLTVLGVSAAAIANPANHRLSAKGSGLNRAVHAAAPALETATRAASSGGVAAAGCVLTLTSP
jgi:O-acetyl-ADP-ribose deacetylase (regulator of RNase III)